MSEISPPPSTQSDPAGNLPVLSVSEVSQAIKRTLEGSFERVRIRGEISGFKRAASGHLYMALKDEGAVIDGVCWRGSANRLGLQPEDGLEVVVTGRVTSYPARSRYQVVIESMVLAGEGALLKLLEQRRRKLAAEGLFDEGRKQPLPFLPRVIGVVTSPTGAVIRDILHRLADRFPRHVLLWPVKVQGEGAAEEIAAAIAGFNALPLDSALPRPDLLIVARGGGSLEDLWAFNEEVVVRAAAASSIPLISAVGHETDTTLIDFAADRRAPTPTAAAEIAVPLRRELLQQVEDLDHRLTSASRRQLEEQRLRLEGLARGLPEPGRLLEEKRQRLDERNERFRAALSLLLERKSSVFGELSRRLPDPGKQVDLARERWQTQSLRLAELGERLTEVAKRDLAHLEAETRMELAVKRRLSDAGRGLEALARLLESTSYHSTLKRGFAVIRDQNGKVLTAARQVTAGMPLDLQFTDGRAAAIGAGKPSAGAAPKSSRRGRKVAKKPASDDPQGSLL